MRIIYLTILSLLLSNNALADNSFEPLLNTVTVELSAEQWVTTQTALITIGVNATVSGSALDKTQSTVLAKLNQISNKGEWHIVSFNRNLDQSGLEKVQISAQARLPSSDLGVLRDRTKAVSKPGETFTLDNVEFTPSDSELRDANTALRNNIYQQVKNELANLTRFYPDQRYFVHSIDFIGKVVPQPQVAMYKGASASTANNISVGNKMVIAATVNLAAAPSQDVAKIVHP